MVNWFLGFVIMELWFEECLVLKDMFIVVLY